MEIAKLVDHTMLKQMPHQKQLKDTVQKQKNMDLHRCV